eukprot:2306173-Ditylum_brightwellii.AAC.1
MYIKFDILFIHADLRTVLSVARQDPLGKHVGLPCGVTVCGTSEVVLVGHSNELPFGMIVKGLSEVDPVEDYVYMPLDRSKN